MGRLSRHPSTTANRGGRTMVEAWYTILAAMLIGYSLLDGFDFGAGILHLFVAKTNLERRSVFAAIGPWWDGNEVWLLAAGGVLFVAFPSALALAFPAFYLALFPMIWALMIRGIAIELRGHLSDALWRQWWDSVFALSSVMLALLFGVALGNVLRGLPVSAGHASTLPLFTDFSPYGHNLGLIDWYTLLVGLCTVLVLVAHGAAFLAMRTTGGVRANSLAVERRCVLPLALAFVAVTLATVAVHSDLVRQFAARPLAWVGFVVACAGVLARVKARRHDQDGSAFAGSCATIGGLLASAAATVYPQLLPAPQDSNLGVSAFAAVAAGDGLTIALFWWPVAAGLVAVWHTMVWRWNRGRV